MAVAQESSPPAGSRSPASSRPPASRTADDNRSANTSNAPDNTGTTDDGSSVGNPQEGCPVAEPTPISCDDGQNSIYIPQTSLKCAHYACPPPKDENSNNGGNSSSGSSSPAVLPAVLGSVIPALIIAAGIGFYLHRRRARRRSMDAQHRDAKFMSSYNNLEENAFGGTMQPPGLFMSEHAGSEWAEPDSHGRDSSKSRASIPIIFSADLSARPSADNRETRLFAGDDSPAYRGTRLYNATTPDEAAPQWAAPSVVNLKQAAQMPQMVILTPSPASRPDTATGLKIDTASAQGAAVDAAHSDATPGSGTGSLTPEDRVLADVGADRASIASQISCAIHIERPPSAYSSGLQSIQDSASREALPAAVANNWESDSDDDLDSASESGGARDAARAWSSREPSLHDEQPAERVSGLDMPLSPNALLDFETSADESFSRDFFGSTGLFDDGSQAKQP
ncbi:hypothetical protein LPJ61_003960 [Coemansia biformis]|uniref:Uncharacterized protein n=1 Tax=Coemansia biformis TaxID=1286918 RepID=A0A9W7YAF3_9FUNG|nr:hypothetical protein LPJ61_003960 [Coemansia biformis]